MKDATRILLLTVLLANLHAVSLSAQMSVGDEPQRPSSEAWDFTRYGAVSPSLYTGTLNLSIPFYTYSDPDFTLPVSFDYATNGFLPNDLEGVLGPGWTLNAGGCVTREIRGVPDDLTTTVEVFQSCYKTIKGFAALSASGLDKSRDMSYLYSSGGEFTSRSCFYCTNTANDFYDAEPDIFHFSLPGYSGTFQLDFKGKIHIYGTNVSPESFKVEVDFSDQTSQICITTGDGMRYEFDGITGQQNDNTEAVYIRNTTILTWWLSRIVAPNGRTVSFSYRPNRSVASYRPDCLRVSVSTWGTASDLYDVTHLYSDTSVYSNDLHMTRHSTDLTQLMGISISGGTEIEFTYEEGVPRKAYFKGLDDDSQTSTCCTVGSLSRIRVRRDSTTVRECTFAYDRDNKGSRNFLKEVNIAGEGSYSMQYNNVSALPMFGTFKVDHWGYFNGRRSNSSFLDVATLADNGFDETLIYDSARTPDATYSVCGTLSRITYPTGGYSEFEYESHSYGFEMRKTRANRWYPTLHTTYGFCGGVRIKSITDKAADGTRLYRRTYEYTVGGRSSGVLSQVPKYKIRYSTGAAGLNELGEIWSNNLSRMASTHIEYEEVAERFPDGSAIRYKFLTNADHSDQVLYENVSPEKDYYVSSGGDPSSITWNDSMEDYIGIFAPTSMQALRGGCEGKILLNSSADTVSTRISEYANVLTDRDWLYSPQYVLHSTADIAFYVGWSAPTSTAETVDFGSTSVRNVTTKTYNGYGQVETESTTDSQGTLHTVQRRYVTEADSGVAGLMAEAGMVDSPTEESVYAMPAGSSSGTLVSRRTISYTRPAPGAHPKLFRVSRINDYDPILDRTSITAFEYDALGRLICTTAPDGASTVYIWGYGGMYPLAEVKGISLSSVLALSGLSNLRTTPLESALPSSVESALRGVSGVEVTTWEYAPLIGLTRETTPDGSSTSYTYNATGKLHEILDHMGRKTAVFLYSTDNKSASAL